MLWAHGTQPKLEFNYTQKAGFYNAEVVKVDDKSLIIYPDLSLLSAWSDNKQVLINEISQIITADKSYYNEFEYMICFAWADGPKKMLDVWKYYKNDFDEASGYLSDVKIYEDGKEVTIAGVASGQSLMILGLEENFRRQCANKMDYFKNNRPQFALWFRARGAVF